MYARRIKTELSKHRPVLAALVGVVLLIILAAVLIVFLPSDSERQANTYEGLTVQQAEQKAGQEGLVYREVSVDGEPVFLNADYRESRLNVRVVEGRVVEAHFDGDFDKFNF